jgi:putative aminopeptidase FrvX
MTTFPQDHPAMRLFEQLLVPSPSGGEEQVAAVVRENLDELGYTHETDGAGNLLVRLPGLNPQAPLCCLASHMDEIGMTVSRIHANGDLAVVRSGGLYPWKIGEGPLDILGDYETITGVLSMGSTHIADPYAQGIRWDAVRVITGLSPAQLKQAGVRAGTHLLPPRDRRGPVFFGDPDDPLVAAWTFDDRMGVVALLRLLERIKTDQLQPHHPTLIAFTVHEENGGNGAKALAQREQPEIFIAVDGAPIPPETDLTLDGRPAIWSKDRRGHYDQRLLRDFLKLAQQAGTELQTAVYDSAASDASLVWYAGGTLRAACIGHVRENSHGYEVARLSVFDRMLDVLVEFIQHWEG